jgi:hypothetical protein
LLKHILAARYGCGVFAGGSFLGSFRLRERRAGDGEGNSESGGGEYSARSGKCAVHDFSPNLRCVIFRALSILSI